MALCNNFDRIEDKFQLKTWDFSRYKALACPIHGGDNPRGLTIYHNSEPYGCWQCNTQGCHRHFTRNAIGFVRGLLSAQEGWTPENGKIMSFSRSVEVCKGLAGHAEDNFVAKGPRILSEATLKKKIITKGITREEIRKRLKIPSEYFQKEENGGFLPKTLDLFDIGEPINNNAKMAGRVIVPIYDENYLYLGCQGRDTGNSEIRWKNSDDLPLDCILYGINFAKPHIKTSKSIILVESSKSVWRLWEAGIHNAVAILGGFKSGQKILIELSGASKILTMFDNDEAGESFHESVVKRCSRLFSVNKIQYGEPGSDPANLTVEDAKNVFSF